MRWCHSFAHCTKIKAFTFKGHSKAEESARDFTHNFFEINLRLFFLFVVSGGAGRRHEGAPPPPPRWETHTHKALNRKRNRKTAEIFYGEFYQRLWAHTAYAQICSHWGQATYSSIYRSYLIRSAGLKWFLRETTKFGLRRHVQHKCQKAAFVSARNSSSAAPNKGSAQSYSAFCFKFEPTALLESLWRQQAENKRARWMYTQKCMGCLGLFWDT